MRDRDRNPNNRDGLALTEAERERMRTTLGCRRAVEMLHARGLPATFDGAHLGAARFRRELRGEQIGGHWRYHPLELDRFATAWLAKRGLDENGDTPEIVAWRRGEWSKP